MALGTIISRITGFVRGILIVAVLGTTLLADTYNVANTMPNILYNLLVGGALTAIFIPQLVRSFDHQDGGDERRLGRIGSGCAAGSLLYHAYLLTDPGGLDDRARPYAPGYCLWCDHGLAYHWGASAGNLPAGVVPECGLPDCHGREMAPGACPANLPSQSTWLSALLRPPAYRGWFLPTFRQSGGQGLPAQWRFH